MTKYSRLKDFLAAASASSALALTGCAGMDAVAAGPMGDMAASAAGIPQTGAFLPNKSAVTPGAQMDIDGTYRISTIGKRIRIDRGRAYAVDPWTHAMTLKIQPDMVVIRNIIQIDDSRYAGDDLPMLGKSSMTLQSNGSIATVISGMIPYRYILLPVDGVEDSPVDQPAHPADNLDECETVVMDPDTGDDVCLD